MKPIYKCLAGVLLLVAVYFVGRRDNKAAQIRKQYEKTVQSTIKYSDGLKHQVDSLTKLAHQPKVDTLIRTISVQKSSAGQLETRLNNQLDHDSTEAALKTSLALNEKHRGIIATQDSLATVRLFQVQTLTVAVMISNQRADSLQHVLTMTPTGDECRILFFQCPSRKVVAITSALAGSYAAWRMTK